LDKAVCGGGKCGARPKVLDEFLSLAPNLLVLRGVEFPTMGKLLKANPTAQEKVFQAQLVFFCLVMRDRKSSSKKREIFKCF